jgi:arylsulfatase A-like enzyme
MNTLCLVVDRLQAGYLGAYGNTWIDTPEWNRLAGQGFVFDQFLIDSPDLASLYRGYWLGRHALCAKAPAEEVSLPRLAAESGLRTLLVTDEPEVARHPLSRDFGDVVELDVGPADRPAEDVAQTYLARCCGTLAGEIEDLREPFFLWCHLGGLGRAWDAPWEFRAQYGEPGDPDPPRSVEVPSLSLPADFDPDQLLGISQAYAGQVSLLDTCLAAVVEALDSSPLGPQTLLVVLSARGFPLGEHGRVGPGDEALHEELVHVPLVMRLPDCQFATGRSLALIEPRDLAAMLAAWHGAQAAGETIARSSPVCPAYPPHSTTEPFFLPARDRVYVVGPGGQRAIRTPAWYLSDVANDPSRPPELYVKPDDRWEVNEVSDRAADVVELLRGVMKEYEDAAQHVQTSPLSPLPDILLRNMD